MRLFRRNLSGKIHPEVERQIRDILDAVDSLVNPVRQILPVGRGGNPRRSSLVENLAVPEIATGARDPILENVGTGDGTVLEVSFTATPTSVFGAAVTNPTSNPAIALTMDNQAANLVLAGPTGGGAAQPSFRALVSADIPGSSPAALVIATKSAGYTLTDGDDVILVDASGGSVTITLHAAATARKKAYYIKKMDSSANSVVIDGNAAETIDGAATKSTTTQYVSFTLIPDGTNWIIV